MLFGMYLVFTDINVCLIFRGHCTILWFNSFELSIPLTVFLVDKAKHWLFGLRGYLAVMDLQYTALMVYSHPAYFFALHPWQHKSHHPLFGFQSSDNWSDVHIIQRTLLKEHHSWHWACRHLLWDAAIKKRGKKLFP